MVAQQSPERLNKTPFPSSGYAALGSGLLVIGFSAILLRLADAPGPVSGFYRMAIGWLLLTPWFIKHMREKRYTISDLRPVMFAGVFFGADMVLWTSGVMLSGATIPTLFANTTPLWVGLGAMLFFREKLKPGFWFGLLVALFGAVLILGIGGAESEHLVGGGLLGLGSAIFYSSFFLAGQRGREKVEPLVFLWVVSFVSSLVLLLAAIVLEQPLAGYSMQTYLVFLTMGVVIQVVGWWLISYAQGLLPASLVSPTMLGQPVLTALLAVPLLGEKLTPVVVIGGVTVICGIFIVHRSKDQQRKQHDRIIER